MTSTNIDYATTYFEFPTLTKIHGEPDYHTLRAMHDEIKSNAIAVASTLGGGTHGHLGLVLSNAEYAHISMVPYIRPAHPGALVIAPGTAAHEADRRQRNYRESIREWRETVDVEKTIVKQIVAALDPKYLKSLRNRLTNSITETIPKILRHLKDTYGVVPPDVLAEKEKIVRNIQYDLREPLNTFFDEVDDLRLLGVEARLPYSPAQLINFATDILLRVSAFEPSLILWNAKPAPDKTWANLLTHFETARKALRLVRGQTMKETGFQQMNHMAEQVLKEIKEVQSTVLQALDLNRDIEDQRASAFQQHRAVPEEIAEQQANVIKFNQTPTPSDAIHLQLLDMMQKMQQEIAELKKDKPSKSPFVPKYCWSHGSCGHSSKECTKKKEGHKDDATFKDKKGGRTWRCKDA